ncbi:MAG: PAS domain-containing sensor histidine kinase [Anaerolineae bacterium]|nr:PAS domain-containing sensor histidine kinase [Anaerolineae bacterium]NUQ04476.1 PAS domain-containing sensor histidine kinase [Anaerolineae bacterium]
MMSKHPIEPDTQPHADDSTAKFSRADEAFFQNIVENLTDLICRYDAKFCLTFANRAYCEWIGQPVEALLGTSLLEKIPAEEHERAIAHVRALTLENPVVTSLHHSILRDGTRCLIEWTDRALFDAEGRLIAYQGSGRDVTERERAARALRASEEKYRSLVESSDALIAVVDEDGQILYVNEIATREIELDASTLVGSNLRDFLSMEDAAAQMTIIREAMRQNSGIVYETSLSGRNGERWFRASVQPVRDAFGRVSSALLNASNITHFKQAEAALQEARDLLEQRVIKRTAELEWVKNRLEAIFNHGGDGILLLDIERGIQQANRAFETLFGIAPVQYLGVRLAALFDLADALTIDQISREVARTHQTGHVEARVHRRDSGISVDVEIGIAPVNNSEQAVTNLVCIIRDITERKQAEDALQRALQREKELNELKSRFVSMSSHEFRTPLASILATTDTLTYYRAKMDDGQIDERLERIRQQVMHMKDIMDDVLQLARLQAGRVAFNPEPSDLDALCRAIVEEFESQAAYRGRITYVPPESAAQTIFDIRLMRQIVSNLIHNALKYSPDRNSVRVKLWFDETEVGFKVSDDGIGIPPEDLDHLFEPFHRATNVGVISGTGLGLTITRQAVELHGGTISVESTLGNGSVFTVTLPRNALPPDGEGKHGVGG